MPNSTVPGLPSMTTPDGTEQYYVVQGGQDRKATGTQILSLARRLLTANANYYVSTSGSDTTGDGSSGNPWATLQFAVNWIGDRIDIGVYDLHIILAAGTVGTPNVYAGVTDIPQFVGVGSVFIETSDGVTTNTKISATGTPILISSATQIFLGGMWLESTGAGAGGELIRASNNCQIYLGTPNCPNIKLGQPGNTLFQVLLTDHASLNTITGTTNLEMAPTGSVGGFIACTNAAQALLRAGTFTITGSPTWSFAFFYAQGNGTITSEISIGNTASGASSGKRFVANDGGIIISNVYSIDTIPGNANGTTANGMAVDVNDDPYYELLTIGRQSNTTGQLKLFNSGSAFHTVIQAGVASSHAVYTLPTAYPPAGAVLTNTVTSSGTLSWTTPISSVGGLPTASGATGIRLMVNDSSAATPTFGSTIAGGGSSIVPVYSDGTTWRVG